MKARHVVLVLVVLLLLGGAFVAVRKLGSAEEKRRQTLLPQVRVAFDGLRSAMAAKYGIELVLVNGSRTDAEQAEKLAQGRSTTNDSWHEVGRAVDVQTARIDPKTKKLVIDAEAKDLESYRLLHKESKAFGFVGIPNGSPFKPDGSKAYLSNGAWDVYHLQLQEGFKTVADARRADAARKALA